MANRYQLWLRQGETSFWFPVNPNRISLSNSAANETLNLEGLGESTIIKSPAPFAFSFSSELPSKYNSMYCNYVDVPNPFEAFEFINAMKNNGPVRFLATNTPFNLACTIETFDISENAGEVGDLKFSISLKEYRSPSARKIDVVDGKATLKSFAPPDRPDTRVKPKTYTVQSGDFLSKISRKVLGDSGKWRDIYILNKNVIGDNPNNIYAGQILKIPEVI